MASTINTSVITGGTNSHASTAAEVNGVATDFISQGVNGAITNTSGVSPSTGSFAVNAQGTPAMFVDVSSGTAYITATPSGQTSQNLRIYMSATYTSYAISSNSSGSTKYDWIYLKVDPTNANTPNSAADNVTSLYTSRSSSNTADNGSPPTYGILLAIVTVANGASSITNGNIADSRTQSYVASSGDNGVSLTTIRNEQGKSNVASGCIWTGDSYGSTLNGSMTAGVVYISGKRVAVSAISAHGFTASKDTYVDVDNTATLHYSEVANGAAAPALSSGYLRLAKVVTGASSIAAASSISQATFADGLGNIIYPKGPASPTLMQNPYKFSVYRNAALSTNSGTDTLVGMDTKLFDTGTNIDVTTNKGRFTAPISGFYQFNLSISVASGGAVGSIAKLYKNGADYLHGGRVQPTSSTPMGVNLSALLQLSANDYIEPYVLTSPSTALNVGAVDTWFQGFLVSAT